MHIVEIPLAGRVAGRQAYYCTLHVAMRGVASVVCLCSALIQHTTGVQISRYIANFGDGDIHLAILPRTVIQYMRIIVAWI